MVGANQLCKSENWENLGKISVNGYKRLETGQEFSFQHNIDPRSKLSFKHIHVVVYLKRNVTKM